MLDKQFFNLLGFILTNIFEIVPSLLFMDLFRHTYMSQIHHVKSFLDMDWACYCYEITVRSLIMVCIFFYQVVGYSIMGAFIFVYLEKENEIQTRQKVGDTRKLTLEQLYGITGKNIKNS